MPPQRRAKTAEEREQVQDERRKKKIRAAYDSRERKRILMEKLQQENEEFRVKMSQMQQENQSLMFQLGQMQLKLNNVEGELLNYRAGSYTDFTASGNFDEMVQKMLLEGFPATFGDQTMVNIEERNEPCVRSTAHL